MINALHLIWIIPVCIFCGYLVGDFVYGDKVYTANEKAYRAGIEVGRNMNKEKIQLPHCQTLEELYDRGFNSDFYKFIGLTGGIIYLSEKSGQLCLIQIDDTDDLSDYFDSELLSINYEGQYCRPIIKSK